MKTRIFLLVLMLHCIVAAQVGKGLELSPYGGISVPISEFADYAATGFAFGLTVEKPIWKGFDLGFDGSVMINPFSFTEDYSLIPSTFPITKYEQGNFRNINLGFGPSYGYRSGKFSAGAYVRGGVSFLKTASANHVFNEGNSFETPLFQLQEENKTSFGLLAGLKLGLAVSDKLGVFLFSQFVYSGNEVSLFRKNVANAVTQPATGPPVFDPGRLFELPLVETTFNPTYFNTSLGITYKLGEKQKKPRPVPDKPNPPDEETNPRDSCLTLTIVKPTLARRVNLRFDEPEFVWSLNAKVKAAVKFALYEVPKEAKSIEQYKLVYETKTTERSLRLPKKMVGELREKEVEKAFFWTVELVGANAKEGCVTAASAAFATTFYRMDLSPDTVSANCAKPAYNNGMVCYNVTETWSFQNDTPNPAIFSSHTLTSSSSGTALTPIYTSAPPPTFPASMIAYQTFTITYRVCVPLGDTGISAQLSYANTATPALVSNEPIYFSLEPCICNACDKVEINVDPVANTPIVTTTTTEDYLLLEHDIYVSPSSPYNVVMVQAELVGYYHQISNAQCATCNSKKTQYGTFMPNPLISMPLANHLTGMFQGGGLARYSNQTGNGPTTGNPPSRDIWWKSTSPLGVNMSPQRATLLVGVPKFGDLANCCEDVFEICIRYTFTLYDRNNENCIKCSVLICDKVTRNINTINNY